MNDEEKHSYCRTRFLQIMGTFEIISFEIIMKARQMIIIYLKQDLFDNRAQELEILLIS